MEVPKGSGEPLYTIFDDYAQNQDHFIRDFVPAMEKMSSNGYPRGSLTPSPDHWVGVECPLPAVGGQWACYIPDRPDSNQPFTIKSLWGEADHKVLQLNPTTGALELAPMTGSLNQQWTRSVSGSQLLNLGTGKPLTVFGYTDWLGSSGSLCTGGRYSY